MQGIVVSMDGQLSGAVETHPMPPPYETNTIASFTVAVNLGPIKEPTFEPVHCTIIGEPPAFLTGLLEGASLHVEGELMPPWMDGYEGTEGYGPTLHVSVSHVEAG